MVTSEWPTASRPSQGSFIARQANFLQRAGVDVEVFAFQGNRRIRNYARAFVTLRARRTDPFDVVHAQFGHSGALAVLATRGPWVVTFRGSDVFGIAQEGGYHPYSRALQTLSWWAAWRAHEAIVVSRAMIPRLPPRAYHVLPSGIDMQRFAPMAQNQARAELGLPPDRLLVLFGGNARVPVKRYGLARQVMAALPAALQAELIVVDNKPQHIMPLYMNACDALLLTSLHEGSPNVVKEALACNLPVVSTQVGDVGERAGGVAGCYVCPDDSPTVLAQALAQVLTARQRCPGRAAVQALNECLMTRQLIDIYKLALAKR